MIDPNNNPKNIYYLFNKAKSNKFIEHEQNTFDTSNLSSDPYFSHDLFKKILKTLQENYDIQSEFNFAELGGGQGHWANFLQKQIPNSNGFVCDISIKNLEKAPANLKKVYANIIEPIFKQNSMNLLCFFVSLHHIKTNDIVVCLKEAYKALAPNGILLIFEPNKRFFIRQLIYKSPFSKDIYHDEHEQALNFDQIKKISIKMGFKEIKTEFLNPKYNLQFVKKLKLWYLYFPMVQLLYILDKYILISKWKKYFTLYGLSIFQKPLENI